MAKEQQNKKLVSVVVPAYKQEATIEADLLHIKNVLDQLRYDYEMIVVVDGKVDKTLENAKKVKSHKITVIGYPINQGKGFAVRFGMLHAKGDIVGFIDSGMDLNPNGLSLLLEDFQWHDADIIIGSKRHPASKVHYPFVRKVVSFLAQVWITLLFGMNVRDTQVGMKFFKGQVIKDVVPRLMVKKFAFDVEILAVAYKLGYKRIFEAPIELEFNFNSNVSRGLIGAIGKAFLDTLAIYYRLNILHYYDDKNKKNWQKASDSDLKIKTS